MKKIFSILTLLFLIIQLYAQESRELAIGKADAIIDLKTKSGTGLVNGTWRYSDAKVVETDFNAVGADLKPSGRPNKT
ncbi:MAG TPA: hypothetical protein PLD84_04555, partial [Chitinophagales bacterium]|nr:hypothetical protein [Chitinophagales bacterium]